MRKRLVFYFYLTDELIDSKVYSIHLNCIKHYSDIFDEMIFVLSVDDVEKSEIVKRFEHKIITLIGPACDITFDIHHNDEFRESSAFKKHVVEKLSDGVLTFFAHGKGITNLEKYDETEIYKWILGMYYYNLNYIDEVEFDLLQKKYMSYGSFLTSNEHDTSTKYHWFYIGTFFWVNNLKIKSYIDFNGVEIPEMADRFYDEEFLSNIYDCWPKRNAASHENKFLVNAVDFYHFTSNYIEMLYGKEDGFSEFCEKMIYYLLSD